MIFFRSQNISLKQQIAFARRFGGTIIISREAWWITRRAGDNQEDDTHTFDRFGTDQPFNSEPAATMLYAKGTPAAGDTLASMYLTTTPCLKA